MKLTIYINIFVNIFLVVYMSSVMIPNYSTPTLSPVCHNNNSDNFSGYCSRVDQGCSSWISTVTFVMDKTKTTEATLDSIKDDLISKMFSSCWETPINITFFAHSSQILNCRSSAECKVKIQKLNVEMVTSYPSDTQTWSKLLAFYQRNINLSKGRSAYVITNVECNFWSTTDLSKLIDIENSFAETVFSCVIVFKFIQIFDKASTSYCNLNEIVTDSHGLFDVLTMRESDLHLANGLVNMCYPESNSYTFPNWPRTSQCFSVGEDVMKCKTWTLFIYIALTDKITDVEVKQITELLKDVIKTCIEAGSRVYIWTAAQGGMPQTACDPSTNACNLKLDAFTRFDLIYDTNSANQIDISSLNQARVMIDVKTEAAAFYIISNLNDEEFINSSMHTTLVNNSFSFGYFLYSNHLITRFVQIKNSFTSNRIIDSFLSLTNSANHYFASTTVSDLSAQANITALSLKVCGADTIDLRSTPAPSAYTGPSIEVILLIVCGSVVLVVGICATCCIVSTKMKYSFDVKKFSRMFAQNSSDRENTTKDLSETVSNWNGMNNLENNSLGKSETIYSHSNDRLNEGKKDGFEMNERDISINYNESLGKGAFAVVYHGFINGYNPLQNACKSINFALDALDNLSNEVAIKRSLPHDTDAGKLSIMNEISIMKEIGYHPHIVNMVGCVSNWNRPLLILEFCENKDLAKLLKKQCPISVMNDDVPSCDEGISLKMKHLNSFAWQVADGMYYLNSRQIIHCDLATRNILVNKKLCAKIADFGLCRKLNDETESIIAKKGKFPIRHMALESLKLFEFSKFSDTWSFGVLLHQIYSLEEPLYKNVQLYEIVDFLTAGKRLPKPELATDEMYNLMRECWNEIPNLRPSFLEIKERLVSFIEDTSDANGYLELSIDYGHMYQELSALMQKAPTPQGPTVKENNALVSEDSIETYKNDDVKALQMKELRENAVKIENKLEKVKDKENKMFKNNSCEIKSMNEEDHVGHCLP